MTMHEEEVEIEEDYVPKICLSRKCGLLSGYFKEANLRINLEDQIRELKEQKAEYENAMDSLLSMVRELLSPHYPAINFFREKLANIPQVTQAHYFVTDQVINLWIITGEEDFEAELQIADSLVELMRIFKNLRFDFMIIPNYDMAIEQIVPEDSQIIYPRT